MTRTVAAAPEPRAGGSCCGRQPPATAIVLNHNGAGFVHEAVSSLLDQDLPGLELIVVDNASTDGSDRDLEAKYRDRLKLLRAPRNLGFGAGNNLGIREARGRHVILLNSDAVAERGMARELVAAADADTRLGMVAPKVLRLPQRDVIDTVGHLLYPDGLNRGRGQLESDRGQYDACTEALFPSGAAALYTRRMLDDIGLFDETFFLYGDDAELGLRGRVAGWGCALAPRALAWHHFSRTAGHHSALKAFHVERNRVLVLLKLFPLSMILASPLHTTARFGLQAAAAIAGRGAAGRLARETSVAHLVSIVLRAQLAALRLAPHALRERRRLRSVRRLRSSEFRRLLCEYRLSARQAASTS